MTTKHTGKPYFHWIISILSISSFTTLNALQDVGEGNVDVGITGIDVVEESNVDVNRVMVRERQKL